ncbi:MAG TPA: NAD(P)H-dependent oxidoreductase [Rhizomicrobium sp.]|nr:NAD(P)H-dependent oxidoreductase [Rhizomicrobium sp.]
MAETACHALPTQDRIEPTESRALRVLVIAGSARRLNSCPGLDSKARALMHRMIGKLPAGWQTDHEDIGNEHGKPRIQACNACVSSSMALCVWPCNCYGPRSETQPDLMWNLDLYPRLARADAWAIIGPVCWYGPSTNLKTMFDRLVCMNGGNPRPDLIDKKNTLKAQALERSPLWKELSKNHLSGRTAAFFCYGDDGANEEDERGVPKKLEHPAWFDAEKHPYRHSSEGEHLTYQGLVWQCRYSDIEVPDRLWRHATFGAGRPYADDQADDMMKEKEGLAVFDEWVADFASHVQAKGAIPATDESERNARSTTNRGKDS